MAISNKFPGPPSANIGPHEKATAITPGDGELAELPRALWVGGAGNLSLKFAGSNTVVVISAVPAGTYVQLRPTHIMAATTATNIVALY